MWLVFQNATAVASLNATVHDAAVRAVVCGVAYRKILIFVLLLLVLKYKIAFVDALKRGKRRCFVANFLFIASS
jgi:hypothetical protein